MSKPTIKQSNSIVGNIISEMRNLRDAYRSIQQLHTKRLHFLGCMAKESSTVAFSNKNLMFFNLKVYLLCFKPTKKPLDAAVDLKFATLKIPLSILLINCKVVFFFTQWQAMRAVGTTHVILYRVDNLSTRSPRP